jgi:hypothetical protein
MIYIKNYGDINSQLYEEQWDDLVIFLSSLQGRMITVFTDSGGISGNGVTGLLMKVSHQSIELLTGVDGSEPEIPCKKNHGKYNHCRDQKARNTIQTKMVIYLEHITAFTYSYV